MDRRSGVGAMNAKRIFLNPVAIQASYIVVILFVYWCMSDYRGVGMARRSVADSTAGLDDQVPRM